MTVGRTAPTAMDEALLEGWLAELSATLCGARLERAYQYGATEIALRLWLRPERATLVASVGADQPALALISREPAEARARSPLLEALRSRCVPSRVIAIEKLAGERIVGIDLVSGPPGSLPHRLLIELLPRAPALLLLDPDGRIVAALGSGVPGKRGLLPGHSWRPPDPAPSEPGAETGGRGRRVQREILARSERAGTSLREAREAFEQELRCAPRPSLYRDTRGGAIATAIPYLSLGDDRESFATFRELVAAWYEAAVSGAREEQLRGRLAAAIEKRVARVDRTLAKLAEDATRAGAPQRDRERGELLLAFQRAGTRAGDGVRVPDPSGERDSIEIPLVDPRSSLVHNANLYFDRYRSSKRAALAVARRQGELDLERRHLEELEVAIANASPGELPGLVEELAAEKLLGGSRIRLPGRAQSAAPRRDATPSALKPRAYRSRSGDTIRVGRSSRGNDHLTFRLAAPDDFWLHAAGPGSHVVLSNPRRTSAPEPDSLVDAAALAAWFSRLRAATKAEVHWTRVRDVRKIPGAPAGMVTLRRYQSIAVAPDRARPLVDDTRAES